MLRYNSNVTFSPWNICLYTGAHKRLFQMMREYAQHEPWLFVSDSEDVQEALKGYAEKKIKFPEAKEIFCLEFDWGTPKVWPTSG